ncbi:MAG: SIS domain-containing protein, partial [Candidatus Diapherotrites archaeon]|nr:SIS domain-containing protein [Candidatus Diapherotrites archaeon]
FLEKLQEIAEKVKLAQKIFILGKGLNYPIALESAIKLQEVCYVPAQGFAGGELKHGPLALIESGTPCIVLLAEDETKKDIISNAIETQSRGAYVIGIGSENPGRGFDEFIQVPKSAEFFPLMILPAVQLLAYFVSIKKGINPDYPRNLAKSVTVK